MGNVSNSDGVNKLHPQEENTIKSHMKHLEQRCEFQRDKMPQEAVNYYVVVVIICHDI